MRKILLLFLLLGAFCWQPAESQEQGFGLGVLLGEPTGVSFKFWTGYDTAINGAAAWSFNHEASLHMHADYVKHNFRMIKTGTEYLPFYYGLGIRIKNEKETRVGIRIPIGINYMFKNAPLDIFVEFVPVFDLVPRTDLFFNGGIGIRYFF